MFLFWVNKETYYLFFRFEFVFEYKQYYWTPFTQNFDSNHIANIFPLGKRTSFVCTSKLNNYENFILLYWYLSYKRTKAPTAYCSHSYVPILSKVDKPVKPNHTHYNQHDTHHPTIPPWVDVPNGRPSASAPSAPPDKSQHICAVPHVPPRGFWAWARSWNRNRAFISIGDVTATSGCVFAFRRPTPVWYVPL